MDISSFAIRKATATDRPAIWNIFHEVVKAGDSYTFDPAISEEEAMAYWLGTDKQTYVAEINDQIAGTYILKSNQPGLGSHVANGSYMVGGHFRGLSVGRKLGEHSLIEARKMGYLAIQFNIVISTNTPAVELWKKLGFNIVGTLPDAFWHQGLGAFVDAYVMYRKL
ncbi:MAG: GNAT family N-acetyltransferase [Alphaproteobacteria bacterium]|nr:GNAT family N-acetyltransferase [Alphaproteobacteria bacterium]